MSAVLTANVLCNTYFNVVDDSKMAIRHEKLGHSCACMLGYLFTFLKLFLLAWDLFGSI